MIASISGRSWSDSAPAGVAMNAKAAAANAAAKEKRRSNITILLRQNMSQLRGLVIHNIVRLNPAGRAGGEGFLRAQRKLPRGTDVAVVEGFLCGRKIGVRLIAFARIGDRELAVAECGRRLLGDRGTQFVDRFVGERLVVGLHKRLAKQDAD